MIIEIGVPVVTWSGRRSSEKTPERIFTASGSWRWVTNLPCPGRRFSSHCWTWASVSLIPGGQPSTTQPSAGPWLSPQVVTRKRWPNVLCDIGRGLTGNRLRRQSRPADWLVLVRGGRGRRGAGRQPQERDQHR